MNLQRPFERSYWAVPKQLLAGCYPGDINPELMQAKLEGLIHTDVSLVVNLMEQMEVDRSGQPFKDYQLPLERLARKAGEQIRFVRYPIRDMYTPSPTLMRSILDAVTAEIKEGGVVYVHCWGGKGRTATVVGCYLVEQALEIPPPTPTSTDGGDGAELSARMSPPRPIITAVLNPTFTIPKMSGFSIARALDGFGPGGEGYGLGSGLGTQMSGLLFTLPRGPNGFCPANSRSILFVSLADSGTHVCNLMVRGVAEQATYQGGQLKGYLCTGGVPNTGTYNVYELAIDSPPQTYYLNAGRSGIRKLFSLNYTFEIEIRGGSQITLLADSIDRREIENRDQIAIPDDDFHHPLRVQQPYDGQFIQIDAISIN